MPDSDHVHRTAGPTLRSGRLPPGQTRPRRQPGAAGGGAFIAEIDGNLTARGGDSSVELHWQKKFRGPDFAPIAFQLRTVTHELLKDTKGRLLPTVIAAALSEAAEEEIAKAARSKEDELLKVLSEHPTASQSELARRLDWKMRDGKDQD